jgi:hypothetical protein
MQLLLLILGGIVGAAQLTVLSGLVAGDPRFSFLEAAGWVLLTIPVGAVIGTTFVAIILTLRRNRIKRSDLLNAYLLAMFTGFPVSLAAPLLLAGAGPDSHKHAPTAFVIQYGLFWSIIIVLTFHHSRRNNAGGTEQLDS